MPDYQKGKIYKIYHPEHDKIYIGSTIRTLKCRFSGHKKDNKSCKSKLLFVFETLPMIELIENYPCDTKLELRTREQYHLDLNKDNIINQQRALMTREDRNRYMCEFRKKPHMKERLDVLKKKHNELAKVKVACEKCNKILSKSSMWTHNKICL